MITVVTGLPRCGTSMMMQMLHAGGMEALTDKVREADVDNPHGYFELEQVKKIKEDASWLPEAEEKVFKMVSMLLFHLPVGFRYQIVFMQRELDEMLASQAKMLARLGQTGAGIDDAQLKAFYRSHLAKVNEWLATQDHMRVHYCSFNAVLSSPEEEVPKLASFVEQDLAVDRMIATIDPTLYRNRA
jgi:hypothetical protein